MHPICHEFPPAAGRGSHGSAGASAAGGGVSFTRKVAPISLAFLASCPAEPAMARKRIAPSNTSAFGVPITARWTAPQLAKPHIIGWRVTANTPQREGE